MTCNSLPCPVCCGGAPGAPEPRVFRVIRHRRYFRCDHCQATFLDPAHLPTREEERRRYDQHNNNLADPGYRGFLERLTAPLVARLGAGHTPSQDHQHGAAPGASPSPGLDFGSGPVPAVAQLMMEQGYPMMWYDPLYAPDRSVLQDRAYRFITCCEVAEHLHHPRETFALLASLLEPQGILAVMTEFQTDDARFDNWYYRQDPTHVVFYREHTLRCIAAEHRMDIHIPRKNVALFTARTHHADQ